MKRSRNILWLLLWLTVVFAPAAAEQITRVGIVDSELVASTFIFESKAYADFRELKDEIETKIKNIQERIAGLEEQKIAAFEAGDEERVLTLADEILRQNNYLNERVRLGKRELRDAEEQISTRNDEFFEKLARAIADTAEAEGISIVLDKKKVEIWYYIDEVDITDAVIKAMNRFYE